jgi:hypothetical protein
MVFTGSVKIINIYLSSGRKPVRSTLSKIPEGFYLKSGNYSDN